jgi:CheY-like chemotaxis protein
VNASNTENRCVLVVDDEEDIREAMAGILEDEGYCTRQAGNGAAALVEARLLPHPNAILLDLMMPVMSGWEFRERQLADPEIAGIPVILVSAGDGRGFEANATLGKPFPIDALLSTVERACFDEARA